MSGSRLSSLARYAAVLGTAAALTAVAGCGDPSEPAVAGGAIELPPTHAGFDYQLGGDYPPPSGVELVVRDRSAPPASGLYNVCYVNGFQAQPDESGDWPADLLLRDDDGKVVMDEEWDEPLLDLRTDDKRRRVADKVGTWIDGCATAGYQAVEPDNYDSYTRSKGYLKADHATAYIRLLSDRAHDRGLAIAQKNTLELARQRQSLGLDFAVVEQCGEYDECGEYVDAYGDSVIIIEYDDKGMATACDEFAGRLSIVRRDVMLTKPGSSGYVRKTC